MMKLQRDGFTLVEMLTVIVIIGIVLAMGIPAITNLMKSGGLGAASRGVSSTLNLARQYAITHRTRTRVVFPFSGTTGSSRTNQAPCYQSYAVVAFGSTTNYLTKWEFLPLGTVFMNDNPILGTVPRPSLDSLSAAFLPFPTNWNSAPLTSANAATLAYIEFNATGAATQPLGGAINSFTITEGLVNSGTIVVPTSKTVSNGLTILANATYFSVDAIVGRIQMTRP